MIKFFLGGVGGLSASRHQNKTGGPDSKPSRPKVAALSLCLNAPPSPRPELRLTPAFRSHSLLLRRSSLRDSWSRESWFRELFPRSTATSAAPRSASCAHHKPG